MAPNQDALNQAAKSLLTDEQFRILAAQPVIFNGKNYSEWSQSVKSTLKQNELEDYLTKTILSNTDRDEKKKSRSVAWQVCQWISEDIRCVFEGPDRFAKEVWDDVKDIYGETVDIKKFVLLTQITRMRITDYEDRTKFVSDFQQTLLQIKNQNIIIPDECKLVFLVNALEDKYKDLTNQAATSTYSEFLKKLKIQVLRPNQQIAIQSSFYTKSQSYQKKPQFGRPPNQYSNPNSEHSNQYWNRNNQRNNYQNNHSNPNVRFQNSSHTNQFNHYNRNPNFNYNRNTSSNHNRHPNFNNSRSTHNFNYRSSNTNNQFNQRNNRGHNTRSFFSGDGAENGDQAQYDHAENTNHNQNEQSAEYSFCNRVLVSGCLPRTVVIHDSASSNPIINNKDFFVNLRPLTEAERREDGIKTGCGNVLKSIAIGTARLVTKAGITIDVPNSRYIPNFEANVIPQPKNKPFNIYADYPDLLFVDKQTGKITKIGHCREQVDNLYQFDLVEPNHPPSFSSQNQFS